MALEGLCPPALIYLVFSLTQIVVDSSKGLYNTALMKFFVMILLTILLNYLCKRGLSSLSYIIVFVPFILMTLIISILLYSFGLDPSTGKLNVYHPSQEKHEQIQKEHHIKKYNLDERKKQTDLKKSSTKVVTTDSNKELKTQ